MGDGEGSGKGEEKERERERMGVLSHIMAQKVVERDRAVQ